MLSLILHDAWARLNPGGRLYLVTINGLRQYMKRNLNEVFGNYKKLKQGQELHRGAGTQRVIMSDQPDRAELTRQQALPTRSPGRYYRHPLGMR